MLSDMEDCIYAGWLPKYANLIIDSAANPIVIIDMSGLIAAINKAAQKKWNILCGRSIGKPLVDVLYGGVKIDSDGNYLSPLIESLESKAEMKGREVSIRPLTCNEPSVMMVTTSILQDPGGVPLGVCAVYHESGRMKILKKQYDCYMGEEEKILEDIGEHRTVQLRFETPAQQMETIHAIVDAIGVLDIYTRGHSQRVACYAEMIAREMGLSAEMAEMAGLAGIVHDLGKISIPENILFKPSALTPGEFEKVKKHPVIGAKMISSIDVFEWVVPVVLHHHERYDGKGYPEGRGGEDIPLLSRVLAVADTFDAMMFNRSYRRAYSRDKAVNELKLNKGTQFDPRVVDAFLRLQEKTIAFCF